MSKDLKHQSNVENVNLDVSAMNVTGLESSDPNEHVMSKEEIDSVDRVVPGSKWEFDESVAKCFNNMLERSIPGYTDMRGLCYELGKKFVRQGSSIVDLGASRGEALRPFIENHYDQVNFFVGLEVSEPMRNEMISEFGHLDKVQVRDYDLRTINSLDFTVHRENNDLVLSVLTLLFTPIQYRSKIIKNVYDMLSPGGAFIVVEKVLGGCCETDDLLVDAYYELKAANGYTPDDIQRKKASLEGVQVPLTHDANVELLKAEGFSKVEGFYRNLNFAGWIAIK